MSKLRTIAVIAVLAISGAGGTLVLHGSSAIAANRTATFGMHPNETTSSCNSSTTCFDVHNNGTGVAISGVAQQNFGVRGEVRQASPLNELRAAVFGNDSSTATNNSNFGVWGNSNEGTGVFGVSKNGNGAEGLTLRSGAYSQSGVQGDDLAQNASYYNQGVYGYSNHNYGVYGVTFGKFPYAVGVGGAAYDNGVGVFGFSQSGPAVEAISRAPSRAALIVANDNGGPLLLAYGGANTANRKVASLDARGNLVIAGNLQTGGTPQFVSHTSAGVDMVTYGTRTSQATIDDVGEAQLIGGQAYVPLERRFAATIDLHVPYLVFITPQGDTRGLYVSQKSGNGFVVRETGGARSSLTFDYRIVGRPYAATEGRLPTHVDASQSLSSEIQQPRQPKHITRNAHLIQR